MMNRRTIRIFAIGLLSVFALNASANDDDTKESLFNPVNYAVIVDHVSISIMLNTILQRDPIYSIVEE